MKRHYLRLLCLALVIGVTVFNLYSDKEVAKNENAGVAANSQNYVIEEGKKAPDFTVQMMRGKEVKRSDYTSNRANE